LRLKYVLDDRLEHIIVLARRCQGAFVRAERYGWRRTLGAATATSRPSLSMHSIACRSRASKLTFTRLLLIALHDARVQSTVRS
jgi:hypothetical protein